MSRVLVVSNDLVQPRMAGPGIRNLELSRQLASAGHDVTLAAPAIPDVSGCDFALTGHDEEELRRLASGSDVVVSQGWVLDRYPFLTGAEAALVVDLYDPFPLETLVAMSDAPTDERVALQDNQISVLVQQIRDGDFFLCASERQRDYWLGALTALGRVNPRTYDSDPTLRSLVDVVPFGIPDEPPRHRAPAMRGVIPGIADGDLIVLWGGGLYNWFDPLTLVRAVEMAATSLPRLRLVLHAARHPNPSVGVMRIAAETRALSDRLGLTGRHVFFNESWVPYDQRADWLLEADIGVTTHRTHVESRFAFRTRVLDYLWAGLPILCTAGDALADTVVADGLGIAVPPDDPAELASALQTLAGAETRAAMSTRVCEFGRSLTWERVAEPLVAFCGSPRRAADRGVRAPEPAAVAPDRDRRGPADAAGVARLRRRILDEYGRGGAPEVARGILRWARRRRGRGMGHDTGP